MTAARPCAELFHFGIAIFKARYTMILVEGNAGGDSEQGSISGDSLDGSPLWDGCVVKEFLSGYMGSTQLKHLAEFLGEVHRWTSMDEFS